MKASSIPFHSTNKFSQLILDYLDQKDTIKDFYKYEPSLEGIIQAAKTRQFSQEQRTLLVDRLKAQYADSNIKLKEGSAVLSNIDKLADENTYTITTGHQLNLMGGPLYSLYKILSVIKLSEQLNTKEKNFHFVPVFWMASEDHDFDEIDHFYFKGEKFQWSKESNGAVGRLDTNGLEKVFEQLERSLPDYSSHASKVLELFKSTYLTYENYGQASRALVHKLFADQGLVIIDGDDAELKRSFIPEMKEELTQFSTEKNVNEQSKKLGENYKLQVNPRQINLFYLNEARERIEKTVDGYALVESKKKLSSDELFSELESNPERFSPNVLMRPMYQERVLPNLAYIGGGGELAYWFQLKQNFKHFGLDFPVLLLRNSILYLKQEQSAIVNDLNLDWNQLFEREGDLIKAWVTEHSDTTLLLKKEKSDFNTLWENLKNKSLEEDPSLGPHVEAQEVRLQKWLDALADKLIRSQRRKSEVQVKKIKSLLSEIAPNGSLQERKESLIELLLIKGDQLVPELLSVMEMPAKKFLILEI